MSNKGRGESSLGVAWRGAMWVVCVMFHVCVGGRGRCDRRCHGCRQPA